MPAETFLSEVVELLGELLFETIPRLMTTLCAVSLAIRKDNAGLAGRVARLKPVGAIKG